MRNNVWRFSTIIHTRYFHPRYSTNKDLLILWGNFEAKPKLANIGRTECFLTQKIKFHTQVSGTIKDKRISPIFCSKLQKIWLLILLKSLSPTNISSDKISDYISTPIGSLFMRITGNTSKSRIWMRYERFDFIKGSVNGVIREVYTST